MAATTVYPTITPAQRTAAATHLSREQEWQYQTIDGVQTILMPSSTDRARIYRVALSGSTCTCHGSSYRNQCSHRLAAVRAGVRRQIIEDQHQEALRTWLADMDGWTPITPEESAIEAEQLARWRAEPDVPRVKLSYSELIERHLAEDRATNTVSAF